MKMKQGPSFNLRSAITNEFRIFFTAIMFLTRIRVPKQIDHSPEWLEKSPKYFPVVGWIVGAGCTLVFLVFRKYTSNDIGILASMVAGILITGAIHEDGFADTCDAFGGGWTKEKILQIMKDSRIGTFGAIGLLAMLGSKYLLLKELPQYTPDLEHPTTNVFFNFRFFIAILLVAHSVSRLMPVWVIQFSDYVGDEATSKSKPVTGKKLSVGGFLLANIFGILPFALLSWQFIFALAPVAYVSYEMVKYFQKWINGYTGDCLGAIQQVSEIIFYLSALIIWRYIV